ncbi:hypothetical protein [Kitasatospora sp. NPDC090308]|uniref:hypothetical protein n=1 Tax=Kitasatospora sp. NPDC090308 TaxID=3364082 RepID=UPI003813FE8D
MAAVGGATGDLPAAHRAGARVSAVAPARPPTPPTSPPPPHARVLDGATDLPALPDALEPDLAG